MPRQRSSSRRTHIKSGPRFKRRRYTRKLRHTLTPYARRMLFEPLEDRLLLTGDETLFVDADATGSQSGLDWTNAFRARSGRVG